MRARPRPAPPAARDGRVAAGAAGLLLLAQLAFAPQAAATDLQVSLTPEYATGRYGQPKSTVSLSAPLDVRLIGERTTVSLRLPLLSLDGPANFVPRIGEVGQGSERRARGVRQGLGDLRLTGAYTLREAGEGWREPYFGIAGQIRIPTATPSDLGSGQVELFLRLDAGANLTDTLSLDVSLGRRFVPFPRAGSGADYWTLFASLALDVTPDWTVGATLDAQDRVPDANRPVLELGAFVERNLTPELTLGAFVWRGFTNESVDWSFGLRLSYRIPLRGIRLAR
jgi:hypothetical protein